VSILDINGQVKNQRKEVLNSGENRMKLDVSTLNDGMYLLSIRDKDAIKTLKFVKQ
jgi:Secretion system C-terminal sorting domain